MTRETAQKHRKEILALMEGKDIQLFGYDKIWHDCPDPQFSEFRQYRIKPREPREFTIYANDDGACYGMPVTGFQQIRVREILTDETP
jgi:hypothetical protein